MPSKTVLGHESANDGTINKKIIINDKACVQINNVNASWITRKNVNKKTKELTKTENQFNIGFIGGFDDLRKGQEILGSNSASSLFNISGIPPLLLPNTGIL